MNFTATRTNNANAIVSGNISASTLEKKCEQVTKKIAKTITINGFRKGKVPPQIVKTRYKEQIEQDAQQEIMQDLLDSGLKELKIDSQSLIGNPAITKLNKLDDKLEVEIKIGIVPNFELDNIEQYTPEVELKSITEAQIDERLDEIAKERASLVEINEDRALKKNDVANIDFEGFVDDKAFEGGKGENYNLTIGSNQFIPGFEDALIGMKKGEKRTIDATFPESYQAQHLAGKVAKFDVLLHKILQKDSIKIDDEFAKSLAGPESDLKKLKEMIKEQLEVEQKNELYNKELKEKLVEALIQNVSFDLPDVIVEQEMDILFRNSLSKLPQEEIKSLREDKNKAEKKREEHREEACKSVKLTFMMDSLAKKYDITIQDNQVLQTIYYEAMMMGKDPKATLEYYQKNNFIPAVKMTMIEDKVLHFMLDKKLETNKKDTRSAKQDDNKEAK